VRIYSLQKQGFGVKKPAEQPQGGAVDRKNIFRTSKKKVEQAYISKNAIFQLSGKFTEGGADSYGKRTRWGSKRGMSKTKLDIFGEIICFHRRKLRVESSWTSLTRDFCRTV
jgi:hypothetical protein